MLCTFLSHHQNDNLEVSKRKLLLKGHTHTSNSLTSQNVNTLTQRCIHGALFNFRRCAIFTMKLYDAQINSYCTYLAVYILGNISQLDG